MIANIVQDLIIFFYKDDHIIDGFGRFITETGLIDFPYVLFGEHRTFSH